MAAEALLDGRVQAIDLTHVRNQTAAGHALLRLRERDAGRAAMLVPVTEGIALPGDGRTVPAADLPDGAIPATEAVTCLLYTSPSPRDGLLSRMPSSA